MIELLAPAKDKICAKAAIDYGADAVYIGAEAFGARKNVPNSLEDIKDVVDYAHKFNVKVYAAVNTILTDKEIPKAEELIEKLSAIGVDAIIIQDIGLLNAVKLNNIYPHASTQCDNRTVEKVKFLQEAGFSRVVLARELSIEQIKEIKKQTDVELEVFIHGALCVSYSGQCYLSHAIGGRSANRGECAQPCRKKYSLQDEDGNYIVKQQHLLCLKDFNASKHLKELAEAGVTSFKIEGRLKDVNYVKNVVGYYRKLIDELGLGKTSSGKVLFDFEPNLEKSFNRGFCDYFLEGRKKCYSFETPKSRGEYIGKVSKIGRDYFEITSDKSFSAQDGLCFFVDAAALNSKFKLNYQSRLGLPAQQQKADNALNSALNNHELSGCLVNKAEKNKVYPNKMDGIIVGMDIYRNFDAEFEKQLKTSKTCRKIEVNIDFGLNKISATDEDKIHAEIEYDFDEFAQNFEKMSANIINQFKKSGESDFLVENIKINTEKLPFLPVSKLNELRRNLFDKLSQVRVSCHCEEKQSVDETIRRNKNFGLQQSLVPHSLAKTQNILDYKSNILNKSAQKFYKEAGFEVKELALESGLNPKGKVVMESKHCLKYAFDMCKSKKKLFLVDEKGKKYELRFDCKKCEMEIVY